MDRNSKIAFGILGTIIIVDEIISVINRKRFVKFMEVVYLWMDNDFQKAVDEKFVEIVENFDE